MLKDFRHYCCYCDSSVVIPITKIALLVSHNGNDCTAFAIELLWDMRMLHHGRKQGLQPDKQVERGVKSLLLLQYIRFMQTRTQICETIELYSA